jgi:ADP-heptose:LPS heptosyltransferase
MLGCLKVRAARLCEEDLQVVAHVLSRAAVYVGNDSGISHLASAAGAPTVALFGPTDPGNWAPRGRSVHILSHSTTAGVVWSTIQSVCRKRPKGIPGSSL